MMDPMTQPPPLPSPSPGDSPPDLTGRTIADFHILRRLGKGGMGEVYLAEQLSLKRHVALKILRPEFLASDPTAMERFRHEAQAVARATHANIVQVYAWGEADGVCWMALEFVEGRNLKDYLARKGPPDVLLALSIMRQVAAALLRAAELGIIHRDVKPENILLTRKGEVKVADFGLSRSLTGNTPLSLTQSGVTMGTPLYMSPEQVEGKPVDPRTDIYSLGVTCYHMLSGQTPFRGESPFEVALQHVQKEPQPLAELRPDLPPALCAIVHQMMAKDPAQRYQTARDLLKDLARLREGLSGQTAHLQPLDLSVELVPISEVPGGTSAAVPTTATPAAVLAPTVLLAPRRRPWLVAASLLLALALGVTCGWLRRHPAAPAYAATVAVADRERIPPSEHEKTLLHAAEEYLGQPNKNTDVQTGAGNCRNLAVFYLEQHRLDDAESLFRRLDAMRIRPYHVLGHLGLGIVAALRSKPHESNKFFRDIVKAEPGVKRLDGLILGQNPQWSYWLARAVDYNRKNHLDDKEIPPPLLRLVGAHP
jgi:serine/threonine-protein kinase